MLLEQRKHSWKKMFLWFLRLETFTCLMVTIEALEQGMKCLSFCFLYCQLWTCFTPCSTVSIVNFEHVITCLALSFNWTHGLCVILIGSGVLQGSNLGSLLFIIFSVIYFKVKEATMLEIMMMISWLTQLAKMQKKCDLKRKALVKS